MAGAKFFVSRSSRDQGVGARVAAALRAAGHEVVIQEDFGQAAPMGVMDVMLAAVHRGEARLVALLSQAYEASRSCRAEAQAALGEDIFNANGRVVAFNIEGGLYRPSGMLGLLLAWPLMGVVDDAEKFDRLVTGAVDKNPSPELRGFLNRHRPVMQKPAHPNLRRDFRFKGREDDFRRLDEALALGPTAAITSSGVRATALRGQGGVGKSTLAYEFAARRVDTHYCGAWLLRAASRETIADDFAALAVAHFGVAPEDAAAAPEKIGRDALGLVERAEAPPFLLVYDNAPDAESVADWLPRRGAHALITSRARGWRRHGEEVDLSVWPLETAVDYLLDSAERDFDRAEAEALAARLGRLPLACAHAKAYCENFGVGYARYLENITANLRRGSGQEPTDADSVFATFAAAIDAAAEQEPFVEAVMARVAHLAADGIAYWLLPEGERLEHAAALLVKLSLLEREAEAAADATDRRRLSVHNLVQDAARARLAERGEAEAAAQAAVAAVGRVFNGPVVSTTLEDVARDAAALAHAEAAAVHAPAAGDVRATIWLWLTISDERRVRRGDADGARAAAERAEALARPRAEAAPENLYAARDMSVSLERLGDALMALGDPAAALARFEQDLAIAEKRAAALPESVEAQRDLSVSLERLGDALMALGDPAAARARFEASLAQREKLAAVLPESMEAQRDLSVSLNKLGDALMKLDDPAAAKARFEASLALREKLAAAQPESMEAQRDLSVSLHKLGDALMTLDDPAAATTRFDASLAIAERLAAAMPDSVEAQRDLWVSLNKLGDALMTLGDLAEAKARSHQALKVAERLAAALPDNAQAQRDLALSWMLTGVLMGVDETRRLEASERALAILERLAAEGRLAPADQPLLAILREVVALLRRG